MVHSRRIEPPDGAGDPLLHVVFWRSPTGSEPVREWLRTLARRDRKAIGEDIKTAQQR